MEANRKLVRASWVAERLGLGLSTVYKMAAAGEIPAVRLGPRRVRFDPEKVELWLRNGMGAPMTHE